jgi:hypothetical protein
MIFSSDASWAGTLSWYSGVGLGALWVDRFELLHITLTRMMLHEIGQLLLRAVTVIVVAVVVVVGPRQCCVGVFFRIKSVGQPQKPRLAEVPLSPVRCNHPCVVFMHLQPQWKLQEGVCACCSLVLNVSVPACTDGTLHLFSRLGIESDSNRITLR